MPPTEDEDSLAESIRDESGEEEAEESETEPEEESEEEPTEEDGEPEEEAKGPDDSDDEPEEDEEPAPSRGSRRIEALAEKNRKLREENEALRRQPHQPAQPPPDPAVAQKQRRESLARDFADFELLTPEQRAERIERTVETGVRNMVQPLAAHFFDSSDRAAFKENYGPGTPSAKTYEKYKAEVERQVQEARSQGINLNRETVFVSLVGKSTLKGAQSALDTARKGAKTRLHKAQGHSPSGRGDAAGKAAKKTGVQEFEEKYGDTPI